MFKGSTSILPAWSWITSSVIVSTCTLISIFLLKREVTNRRKSSVAFTNIWFEYTSITCISCGCLAGLFTVLRVLNGFCQYAIFVFYICLAFQGISMGFYHLSRLYYCLANQQIHSKKGYPRWLFKVMFGTPLFMFITWIISAITSKRSAVFRSMCAINDKWEYQYVPVYLYSINSATICVLVHTALFSVWDISILLLYIYKIISFAKIKEGDQIVYERVMMILYKVSILTLFYQITAVISITIGAVIWIIYPKILKVIWFLGTFQSSLAMNYSMYLMMDHNKNHYIQFLKIIRCLKLNWICCNWRYIVHKQLNELEKDPDQEPPSILPQAPTIDTIVFSMADQKINTNGNELSLDTIVMDNTIENA